MQIGDRIKIIRQTIGITQARFAGQMAISVSYLAELEKNKKVVNDRIVRLICLNYNVNELWLRTGSESMFAESVDAHSVRVNGLFKSLSQEFQLCAIKQLEELATLDKSGTKRR
ncbi:MAG: helix-turn-helix domain-containing protein [Defluviitaleaceae bacterium]|nr:helix-turn-helix domain-containing protein [Defluviitaleaceae bacterium]MCL2274496.1 helix-turn-helix domain-containing protein [Defluviitaleaceae bacterium]